MKAILILSLALNIVVLAVAGLFFVRKGGMDYLRAKYVERFVDSPYADPSAPYHESTYHRAFQSQFTTLPVDSNTVLFVGDSHVERGRWEEYLQFPVRNRGIGGEEIENLRWRAESLTRGAPKQIFLWTGANDARLGRSPDYILATYDRILETLRAKSPRTQLFVLSIPPFGRGLSISRAVNERIQAVNSGLEEMAERHGATVVDAAAAVTEPNGRLRLDFSFDHLHLNANGIAAVAERLRPYLADQAAPESPSRVEMALTGSR
jgi:lysophospholipase L1-like esterase